MPFEVIPALDVAGGRLVARHGVRQVAASAFGGDPSAAATAFVEAGAPRLHVVDVDLARSGELGNGDVLRAVSRPGGAGAGERRRRVRRSRSTRCSSAGRGAGRARIGGAARPRPRPRSSSRQFGDRLVVGIEADGPHGPAAGHRRCELPLWDLLVWLAGLEVRRYLFTEVGRVGGLEGPDLDGDLGVRRRTRPVPVVAAGGIRGVEDLRAVAALGGRIEGAVIGRALYEGLDLAAAIAAVA